MSRHWTVLTAVFFVALLSLHQAQGRPYRSKRTSDHRLAELQTLLALNRMKGKLVTVPIGFGLVDPEKLGRRRRSTELLLQELLGSTSQDSDSDQVVRPFSDEVSGEVMASRRNYLHRSGPLKKQPWLPDWEQYYGV